MSFPTKNRLYRELVFEQEGKCFLCQIEDWKLPRRLQLHRVIPGSQGGTYTYDNVILVCFRCHKRCEGITVKELAMRREQVAMAETVMPS